MKKKTFRVHFPREIVKLKELSDRLCVSMPSEKSSYEERSIELGKDLHFVPNTVKECLEHFSEAMKK